MLTLRHATPEACKAGWDIGFIHFVDPVDNSTSNYARSNYVKVLAIGDRRLVISAKPISDLSVFVAIVQKYTEGFFLDLYLNDRRFLDT